jgi:hypothetical protein
VPGISPGAHPHIAGFAEFAGFARNACIAGHRIRRLQAAKHVIRHAARQRQRQRQPMPRGIPSR